MCALRRHPGTLSAPCNRPRYPPQLSPTHATVPESKSSTLTEPVPEELILATGAPFNSTPMAVNSSSVGSPHVRPTGVRRTCGEPNEKSRKIPTRNLLPLFFVSKGVARTRTRTHTRSNARARAAFQAACLQQGTRTRTRSNARARAAFQAACLQQGTRARVPSLCAAVPMLHYANVSCCAPRPRTTPFLEVISIPRGIYGVYCG